MSTVPKERRLSMILPRTTAAAAPAPRKRRVGPVREQRDVVIVGMGFSGMALTYKLRSVFFTNLRSFETGSDVGGTWFWNRWVTSACVHAHSTRTEAGGR